MVSSETTGTDATGASVGRRASKRHSGVPWDTVSLVLKDGTEWAKCRAPSGSGRRQLVSHRGIVFAWSNQVNAYVEIKIFSLT